MLSLQSQLPETTPRTHSCRPAHETALAERQWGWQGGAQGRGGLELQGCLALHSVLRQVSGTRLRRH